ncbi:hypothetical protein [Emticicia sp.]|uniref:hypothetical protein n=1 Tax=Emticicia sp. TaxID=1930953 RepID=UPI003750C00D
MTMHEYSKIILEKVSFEPKIFKKELRKALRQSTKDDFKQLMSWCREKFSKKKELKNTLTVQ